MTMKGMKKKIVAGAAFLGVLSLSGATVYAVDVSMDASVTLQSAGDAVKTNDVEFGTVTLDPTAATLEIDASAQDTFSSVRATPTDTAGSSTFSGTAGSGLITITSPIEVLVTVDADDTATLGGTSGATLTLSGIKANSTTTYTHPAGGFANTPSYVHIGGVITIADSTAIPMEAYSTSTGTGAPFNVTIDFQ